jgi:hypothetical protein
MLDPISARAAGWFVHLGGREDDLHIWARSLPPPDDPWCDFVPDGPDALWALRSRSFGALGSPEEVKAAALPLIDQLNGALAITADTRRVTPQGVGRIYNDQGATHMTVFPEAALTYHRFIFEKTTERQAYSSPVSTPANTTLIVRSWIKLAAGAKDVADLLVFAGRQDNWFDIYKTIEVAERIVGGERELRGLLGESGIRFKNMK